MPKESEQFTPPEPEKERLMLTEVIGLGNDEVAGGKGDYVMLENWPNKKIYIRFTSIINITPLASHIQPFWGPVDIGTQFEVIFNDGKWGDVNEIKELVFHGRGSKRIYKPFSVTDNNEKIKKSQ